MEMQKKTKTHFIPTSQLKIYNVISEEGEDLGQVQNFIIDMCSARIAYVLVAFEGFLGLTDKWIPIPFEVLTWIPEKHRFEMDISRKTLEKAPTISKSAWPDKFMREMELQDHSVWLESVYDYYNCTPYWLEHCDPCETEKEEPVVMESVVTDAPIQKESSSIKWVQPVAAVESGPAGDGEGKEIKMKTQNKMETHFIPASRLQSYSVIDDMGQGVGEVERIIVDLCSGKVAYYLVGLKGHVNDRWVSVPPDAVTWQPARHDFKLGISRKTLEGAPIVLKADWPDKFLVNLEKEDHGTWLEGVYAYYGYTPFWIVIEAET